VSFDANSLIASFVVGSIGFVLLMYGKRQSRVPQMVVGLALIAYPYFVANLYVMGAIAAALLAGLWTAVRLGW
jgi:hypothetical protein